MTLPTEMTHARETDSQLNQPSAVPTPAEELQVSETGTTVAGEDVVATKIAAAVATAVDEVVDTALVDAAESGQAAMGAPVGVARAAAADQSGWLAARRSALQAAAAAAVTETAKTARDVAARRAKAQAAVAAEYSRAAGKKAALAARTQASETAKAAQQRAAQTAAEIRSSGGELLAGVTVSPAIQKVSRKARRAAELQQQQTRRLRRRWTAAIVVLTAVVGVAVGLIERRRRAAAATSTGSDEVVAATEVTSVVDITDAERTSPGAESSKKDSGADPASTPGEAATRPADGKRPRQ